LKLPRKALVLVLDGTNYRVHGEFRVGEFASSRLLPELKIGVDAVVALGKPA
jgi:hypothetical protein